MLSPHFVRHSISCSTNSASALCSIPLTRSTTVFLAALSQIRALCIENALKMARRYASTHGRPESFCALWEPPDCAVLSIFSPISEVNFSAILSFQVTLFELAAAPVCCLSLLVLVVQSNTLFLLLSQRVHTFSLLKTCFEKSVYSDFNTTIHSFSFNFSVIDSHFCEKDKASAASTAFSLQTAVALRILFSILLLAIILVTYSASALTA